MSARYEVVSEKDASVAAGPDRVEFWSRLWGVSPLAAATKLAKKLPDAKNLIVKRS